MQARVRGLEERYRSLVVALPDDIAQGNREAIASNIAAVALEVCGMLEALDRQELFE